MCIRDRLKAGGAYLPLDPEYPAQRLSFMIGDSGSVFVISDGALYAGLDTQDTVLPPQIDVYDAALLQQLESLPDGVIAPTERIAPLQPDHLAYLIYTSGSTGTPKGAGNSHDGITNRLSWMQDVLKLTEEDRILQKTAIGFDVSVWEWVLPLIEGSRLIIAAPGGHKDPVYLSRIIDEQSITVINFVPSMLSVFLQEVEKDDLPSLKQIISIGEALTIENQEETFNVLPDTTLWNMYGPAEAAVYCTVWQCLPDDKGVTPPIGSPIWNTQLYILDPTLTPVPDGIAGESVSYTHLTLPTNREV